MDNPSSPGHRFELGRIMATPGAIETLARKGIDPFALIQRHVTGDWGDIDEHDAAENAAAVEQGTRILSAYGGEHDPDRLWVITQADRSVTTILRPDEY